MQRVKKVLKRLALLLGILLVLALIANAVLVWRTGKRLEDRLTSLRAAGEPLSLADLGAIPVEPGADAAAVLKRIEPEIKALSRRMAPVLNRWSSVEPKLDKDWDELEKAIADHPTLIPALQEAAACPVYRSPMNFRGSTTPDFLAELLPHVQLHRDVANILNNDGRLKMRRKDFDGAMRSCLTSLRISRLSESEPLLISYLVALATRQVGIMLANDVLRSGPVHADLHRDLETLLANASSTSQMRQVLRVERAYGLQALDEMNEAGWISRAYFNDEKCFYLDLLSTRIAQADSSFTQFLLVEAVDKQESGKSWHPLSRLLAPAFDKVRHADFRSRCAVNCLRVLNALTAKKLNEVPASLADLGLPATAILDPYTDKPLLVKRVKGHWLIYGLGANQTDDGGQLEKLDDVGLGPMKETK